MLCDTVRFGPMEVREDDIINFPQGLPGFPDLHHFFTVPVPDNPAFLWLQAAAAPEVAFLLTDPFLFFPGYSVKVPPAEEALLGAARPADLVVYVILRVPVGGGAQDITANLLAPVLINPQQRIGCQVVMEGSRYHIREPLFSSGQGAVGKGGRAGAHSQP